MNVATITMPADEARAKLDEYREGLEGREPTNEDQGIVLGLRYLAKGKSLIDLRQVFRACPLDDKGLPKLAVARATWKWAHFSCRTTDNSGLFADSVDGSYERRIQRPDASRRLAFPAGTFPAAAIGDVWRHRALVPLIPPNLRPYRAIQEYLILFEAEWQPIPPRDPMLLRPLKWPLCVVLAHWDLTELERSVLSGRLIEAVR